MSEEPGSPEPTPAEPPARPLRETHERLYGALLSVSEELSDAGSALFFPLMLAAAAFCLALHLRWLEIEPLRSIWFYVLLLVGAFFAFGVTCEGLEKAVYRRRRSELFRLIHQAGLDRYTVLARIVGDAGLKDVAEKLKQDDRFNDTFQVS